METSILKVVGQIAGIGGIALGVFLLIFRDIIRKNIFPTLTKEQAYRLIRLMVVLAFITAVIGVSAWVYTSKSGSRLDKTSVKVEPGSKPIQVQLVSPGREIPVGELPPDYTLGSEHEALEITDIAYDQIKQELDVKVRNNSQESTVVQGIKILFVYNYNVGASLDSSGTHDARIGKEEIETAKANKVPLSFEKAFAVSYVIPPKGADRYLFKLNLNKADLYYPESQYGGEYSLWLNLYYNKGKESGEMVLLPQLLDGTFRLGKDIQ